MLNILKSEFYKLKKSKAFWVCTALCLIFGIIMIVAMQSGMTMAQQPNHDPDLDSMLELIPLVSGTFMLGYLISMGFNTIFVGIFVAVFISSEFSYGTMKNTLSRGADRIKVFFIKFLVCGCAALIMQFVFMITVLLAGTIIWGFGTATFSGMLGMVLTQSLLTLAYTALFTFISMTMRAGGGAIAVNIMCVTMASTLLDAISMLFGGKLNLNNYWIGGAVSKLATITPASGDIIQGIIIATAWGAAAILFGMTLFKKQDVK